MKISRLNKYREIRGDIARNRRCLKGASLFMYADPKFPTVIAELAEKTAAIEKYCVQHYSDVMEFVAASALQDPETGYVLKAYYHDAMTWEQLADAGCMDPKHAEELARSYGCIVINSEYAVREYVNTACERVRRILLGYFDPKA